MNALFKPLKVLGDRTFTALILALIAILISYSGVLSRLDFLHYDLGYYFSAKPAPEDIVIVAIDETSLDKIGRWPWSRTVHSDFVQKLTQAQAKVIGLDLIFTEPENTNPNADIALAQAIKQAGNVVLPHSYDSTNPILSHAAATGHVRVPLDLDGLARSIYLWEGFSGGALPHNISEHFSQAVLRTAQQLPTQMPAPSVSYSDANLTPQQFVSLESRKIKFLGAPKHFRHVAYSTVMDGQYPDHFFKDKIVLIGATAAGLGDVLPTPVSAMSEPMPGVEFHANAIAAMRSGELIQQAPFWLTSLCCVFLAILPLLFLPKFSPLKSLIFILAYYLLVTLFAAGLPQWSNVWIPPSGAFIAILLAYPIWSWRKLESARVHLDQSLQHLQAELALLGLNPEYDAGALQSNAPDEMQSRIAKVELTSQYLREAQQKRLDTLAFISHDIRTPLATAMMQFDEPQFNQARVKQMLTSALNMADEFLQSSRAEMADTSKFKEIEIKGLIQQVVDDVYDIAWHKNIRVHTNMPEQDLWVKGDFGLLQRALTNLLLNAVKYSREDTVVTIDLSIISKKMIIKVTDTGQGIPAEKIGKLFKRFSRVEGEYQLPIGTGLGLYFVDVCVHKHGGNVSVESKLGLGAQFAIELPLVHVENT